MFIRWISYMYIELDMRRYIYYSKDSLDPRSMAKQCPGRRYSNQNYALHC